MKKDKTIYWIATAIIGFVMMFSLYKMFTPDYDRLSLPNYLRTELAVFKIAGLIVLFIPQFSTRLKEWAYSGFGVTLISASVAHYCSGDSLIRSLEPIIFLVILAISNSYLHKIEKAVHEESSLPEREAVTNALTRQ
ncbi:DoxX family protein [Spirosoma endbachense]|uniref:DoxX family protein n=1 Tax=Spirosoma endbachense TaxID=2666025 RepID=A0A6P1VRG0_9BACT|nr:DoxX family protein [Spirosoma endbachense]QHV93946.1 DoxX family protein [Spirosoma endbachense]